MQTRKNGNRILVTRMNSTGSRIDQPGKAPNAGHSTARSADEPIKRDWTLLKLTLWTIVSGSLVAIYVIVLGVFTTHKSAPNIFNEAALYATRQLSQLYVEQPSFGKIGLCDQSLDQAEGHFDMAFVRQKITSINTLYKTLAVDQRIGTQMGNQVIIKLAANDLELARKAEQNLCDRLHAAAEPDLGLQDSAALTADEKALTRTTTTIYRNVYRMLSQDRSAKNYSLCDVKIRLGRSSMNNAHWPNGEIRIISPDLFRPCDRHTAPYMVLIEAAYQSKPNSDSSETQTIYKRACALIASRPTTPAPSALVFNFPDGMPTMFRCVNDILYYNGWTGRGDWQQAVGIEVPGKGSLAPPLEPVLPGMAPNEALSVGLYHWLKQMGPAVNERKFAQLLAAPWGLENLRSLNDGYSSPSLTARGAQNSCLAVDTGAREYAIMYQTVPGGIGQLALSHLFNINQAGLGSAASSQFPNCAIPLFVDAQGVLNLPGVKGFDAKLINDYLKDTYDTNFAAVESISVAKMAMARATAAVTQVQQKMFIEQQELNSVQNRLIRMGSAARSRPSSTQSAPEREQLRQSALAHEKINSLSASIKQDEEMQARLTRAIDLITITNANAIRFATTTFELCSHARKLCREGIAKTDGPKRSYVISHQYIFTPQTRPPDEAEFFAPRNQANGSVNPLCAWFNRGFDVLVNIRSLPFDQQKSITVNGEPLPVFLRRSPLTQRPQQVVCVLSSRSLVGRAPAEPMRFSTSPFSGLRIPNGQLFYYCQNAVTTGTQPRVCWSVAIRDLVASKPTDEHRATVGEPVPALSDQWCDTNQHSICPGLACEFQLRTPLPVLPRSILGSSLTNPTDSGQVPQIPPVPPDMP